jgi:uncharacterized protein YutE (UPF0331/DUF86 family)
MADKTISVSDLFDVAYDLAEERSATLEKQAANREVLRNLDKMGMLDKKESEQLAEIYPIRERVRADSEDAAGAGE